MILTHDLRMIYGVYANENLHDYLCLLLLLAVCISAAAYLYFDIKKGN